MKPLLIIPPAPQRWPALRELLAHKGEPWLNDLRRRLEQGVPGAHDVYAVDLVGSQYLANVGVNRWGDVGVLGHCYTRPEHRRKGLARRLMQAALSWFDMTGWRWLFLGTTAELDEAFYRPFGFEPLRRVQWSPHDRLTMIRRRPGAAAVPYDEVSGEVTIRPVTRAEWPAMVALLQFLPGLDPRVALDESAVTAELFTLDLIEHLERGAVQLSGAFRGERLVGLGTLVTERAGPRTYAMLMPHTAAPPELRAALLADAQSRGYEHVEFPMETLDAAGSAPRAAPGDDPPGAELRSLAAARGTPAPLVEPAGPELAQNPPPEVPAAPE